MKRLSLLFLIIISLAGCSNTQQTVTVKDDATNTVSKKTVSNIIAETKIIGEIQFKDDSKGLTILVSPVDARKFAKELQSGNYRDGRHQTIYSSIDEEAGEETSVNNFDQLINRLLVEGLTIDQVQLVTEAIQGEIQEDESLFIYDDPEIYLYSDYAVNDLNPFTLDGRYMSVIEFEIVNDSDKISKVCNNNFLLKSDNVLYKSIPTHELLNSIPSTTIQYELLHKLLMRDCEVIPPDSKITTHLVYPSFYSEQEVTVHYSNQETLLKDQFIIEHDLVKNEHSFYRAKIKGDKGYRIIEDLNNSYQVNSTSKSYDFYHFIRSYSSMSYIGFNEFFIHDKMNLNFVEIFSVDFQDGKDVSIYRTPIKKEDLTKGLIEEFIIVE